MTLICELLRPQAPPVHPMSGADLLWELSQPSPHVSRKRQELFDKIYQRLVEIRAAEATADVTTSTIAE